MGCLNQKEIKKVAVINTVGLIYDGITSVIVSYLEAMECSGLEIFVIGTIKVEPEIEKRIKKLGCHVIYLPSRRDNILRYFFSLVKFIRKNKIDVLHAHGNSATLVVELLAGVLGGAKRRIAHSHNTTCSHIKADKLMRPLFKLLYTDALACGKEAGKWLFKDKKFLVLKNGRNIEKYSFNKNNREIMREKLNISNKIAIGHVGGFFEQKNHIFLIEIFREIYKENPACRFFVIGDGPLKPTIEKKVGNLKDVITFTGAINNVEEYLQAMDAMILPSLFEGLPLVAIEWQINGLPSLLADSITRECAITNTVSFESLEEDPQKWAKKILDMIEKNERIENSKNAGLLVKKAGFDIKDNAQILKQIYLS